MGATFVVTLQEAFEAALLLGIVYTYLDRIGARQHWTYVTTGGGLGVGSAAVLGWVIHAAVVSRHEAPVQRGVTRS